MPLADLIFIQVDADTKVYPKSMRTLCNAMMRDHMVMGACGETRIANKRSSWVTAIQVYEYFISHHMVKAFESVFGGVTCLPGCFSMYRIKARKPNDDDWVPVIVKPEVTREYSQSVVTTLHQKNLLLLGEDRFLTTLLLRTFPNRKMIFVPQARCRTEVPHTFKMLLSQRRRWINSTVHNLMELVLVRDLCGTFCFSMQFVVFMDLIGTAVLPVAICLTYTLIASYIINPPHGFTQAIPLMLLVAVIGLPAVLILLATRKVVYTMWMLIYLIFLPVWNFILPVYSFWHFDDFSWGETRKVEGETKGDAHGDSAGVFAAASVPLRRWEDWERSRLKRQAREEKRRREMEKQFGGGFYNDIDSQGQHLHPAPALPNHIKGRRGSDSFSDIASSEGGDEDVWGHHIGAFNEEAPPPLKIQRHSVWIDGQEVVVEQDDMEKILNQGWNDDKDGMNRSGPPLRPSASLARRNDRQAFTPAVPRIPDHYSHRPPPPQQPRPPNLQQQYSNHSPYQNNNQALSPFRGPLSPGVLVDRTPSPAYGEDVILLRGGGGPGSPFDSGFFNDGSSHSSLSLDRERGASTAIGAAQSQSHARNRSSGTHNFSGNGGPHRVF